MSSSRRSDYPQFATIRDRVRHFLPHINSADRITCLKVFSVIKKELGYPGFDLADEFAQSAHNYESSWVKANFDSVDGRYGLGLLPLLAQDNGFISRMHSSHYIEKGDPEPRRQSSDRTWLAKAIWRRADVDDRLVSEHPYAENKEITWAAGAGRCSVSGSVIGKNADCLVIPVRRLVSGELQGVQCINPAGKKQNFGSVRGGGFIIGNTSCSDGAWGIAEGWASTVALVHWHNFDCAICSFGKSRYDEVSKLVAKRFSPLAIKRFRERDD